MSAEEQAAQMVQLLDLGVNAIIIKPMGGLGSVLRGALDSARDAGVPVVTQDSPLDHGAVVATAQVVFDRMQGARRVAYFADDYRLPAGAARNKSFHHTLAKYAGIELAREVQLDWVNPMPRRACGAECMRAALTAAGHVVRPWPEPAHHHRLRRHSRGLAGGGA